MKTLKKLKNYKSEINRDWFSSYTAEIINDELRVYLNNYHVSTIDKDYEIKMEDNNHSEVEEQLTYMVER